MSFPQVEVLALPLLLRLLWRRGHGRVATHCTQRCGTDLWSCLPALSPSCFMLRLLRHGGSSALSLLTPLLLLLLPPFPQYPSPSMRCFPMASRTPGEDSEHLWSTVVRPPAPLLCPPPPPPPLRPNHLPGSPCSPCLRPCVSASFLPARYTSPPTEQCPTAPSHAVPSRCHRRRRSSRSASSWAAALTFFLSRAASEDSYSFY